MAVQYLDTSALAKRYLDESGSAWIVDLTKYQPIAVSSLTFAELASVLARRVREHALATDRPATILETYADDAEGWLVIETTGDLIQRAAGLISRAPVPLRAMDGLQLVCALEAFDRARQRRSPVGAFVSSDRRLLAAAEWAGFAVENPEDYAVALPTP